MDQVTYTKSEFRAQKWAEITQSCQSSGQTVSSWCTQHEIGIKSYYYWLRKLRLRAKEECFGIQNPAFCSSLIPGDCSPGFL